MAFFPMDKSEVAIALIAELRRRHQRLESAFVGAREGATGSENRAEHKYDTRGLEASYLAAGLAEQWEESHRDLLAVEGFEFRDFDFDDEVDLGALVEVEQGGDLRWYLLAPAGGGIELSTADGEKITVLSPSSPLGRALSGQVSGAVLSDPEVTVLEVF